MPPTKDIAYHEAAIEYNERLAEFADDLAGELEHPEIARWSRAVSRQHEFHADRHKKSLAKLKKQAPGATDETEDATESIAIDEPVLPAETPIATGDVKDPFTVQNQEA